MSPHDLPTASRRAAIRGTTRGTLARGERPAKPGKPPKPPEAVPPREVLLAAMAEADARLAKRTPMPVVDGIVHNGNLLPAIGACHDCGRDVPGERRFCGPCLAKH